MLGAIVNRQIDAPGHHFVPSVFSAAVKCTTTCPFSLLLAASLKLSLSSSGLVAVSISFPKNGPCSSGDNGVYTEAAAWKDPLAPVNLAPREAGVAE